MGLVSGDTSVRGSVSSGSGEFPVGSGRLAAEVGVFATAGAGVAWLAGCSGSGAWLRAWGSAAPGTMGAPRGGCRRACDPGLLALRSASGLGLPAARRAGLLLQRSTELVRSSGRPGESCPGCRTGLVPDAGTGSLSPSSGRKVWAHRGGCGESAGQAASARGMGAPEATAGSQLVPWMTME